jgi:hypothetical protein
MKAAKFVKMAASRSSTAPVLDGVFGMVDLAKFPSPNYLHDLRLMVSNGFY